MTLLEGQGTVKLCLAWVSIAWYAILWSLGLLGCRAAYVSPYCLSPDVLTPPDRRKRYRSQHSSSLASADASAVPGVSILRPLKGLDTNLYENLESTFTQEYPNYEIFLSVDHEDDQALPVVRELISKYPNVNAHIVIGECPELVRLAHLFTSHQAKKT